MRLWNPSHVAATANQCCCLALGRSADCLSQNCLVGPPPGAAARELAVDDDTGQAADAELFGPGGDVRLMHVMNFDVVVSARNASDQGFGLMTRRAASGENFDLSPSSLGHASLSVELVPCRRARLLDWRTRNRPVGTEDAAITGPRAQECAAAGAFIEKLTGVRRHRLTFRGPAYRAGDGGIRDHRQRSAED